MAQVKVLGFSIDVDLHLDWMDGIKISDCNLKSENKPGTAETSGLIAFTKLRKPNEINSTSLSAQ